MGIVWVEYGYGMGTAMAMIPTSLPINDSGITLLPHLIIAKPLNSLSTRVEYNKSMTWTIRMILATQNQNASFVCVIYHLRHIIPQTASPCLILHVSYVAFSRVTTKKLIPSLRHCPPSALFINIHSPTPKLGYKYEFPS